MLLALEPLKAQQGDSLLLHWGTGDEPRLAVIDGGPGQVWERELYPRLATILDRCDDDHLPIELVMVSHVDNDHIVGIKKFFRRLTDDLDRPPPDGRRFTVKRLWHNTFNDILDDNIDRYYDTLTASLTAAAGATPSPALEAGITHAARMRGAGAEITRDVVRDVALVLAGHQDGRELRDRHRRLRDENRIAALNSPFQRDGHPILITADAMPAPVDVAGLHVTVIGPLDDEIQALQAEFDKYIRDKGLSAESVLAAYADRSVTNLASIVCLVEHGGKSILLTGDASGDRILEGLERADRLDDQGRIKVDVLKVPHHGSDNNVTAEFFDAVSAQTYVLSGNGKHGNPERATVEWIIESRDRSDEYCLLFTYPIDDIDAERKREAGRYGHSWTHATDAVRPIVDRFVRYGHPITIVDQAPFTISLGDETID